METEQSVPGSAEGGIHPMPLASQAAARQPPQDRVSALRATMDNRSGRKHVPWSRQDHSPQHEARMQQGFALPA